MKNQINIITDPSYPECLIIEKPECKSNAKKIIDFFLAFFLWCWWISLWIPLAKIIFTFFGLVSFSQTIPNETLSSFIINLYIFLSGAIFVICCTVGWSWRNYKKYGHANRRKKILETDSGKLAAKLGVCKNKMSEIHSARRIVYFFSENDSIRDIDLSINCI